MLYLIEDELSRVLINMAVSMAGRRVRLNGTLLPYLYQ